MDEKPLFLIEIALPHFLIDAVSNRILELGIQGTWIQDEKSPPLVSTFVEGEDKARIYAAALADYFEALKELFPGKVNGEVRMRKEDSVDWAHAWKRFFKPLNITDRLVVKPTWEKYTPKPGQLIIEIDPEMAFGAGSHETTRLCLTALDKLSLQQTDKFKEFNVFDAGTGTGILSIAAAKMGAKSATGTDIDPIAVDTAKRNAKLNNVAEKCEFFAKEPDELGLTFDMVIANINSDTLLQLAPKLASVHNPDGILLLTGIMNDRADEVQKAYENVGYYEFSREILNEWSLLIGKRKP